MDQILHSMPTVQIFWYERLRRGQLDSRQSDWGSRVSTSQLHGQYLTFAEERKDRHPLSVSQFGKELKKLCPSVKRKKATVESGKRYYVLEFPDLDTCRQLFEELVKMELDWDN